MIVAKGSSTAYWMLRHEENSTQGRVRWYASENSTKVADIKVDLGATRWAYDTWHHIAVTSDGTTHALLVDGTCVGACKPYITNWDYSGNPIVIGNNVFFGQTSYGYIDEVRITKGVSRYSAGRYTVPTTPFEADANTKLLIQSDFSEGGLGADHSNNYNYFTPTNLTADDMMPDSPMNNFATLNSLDQNGITLSEGNLKAVGATGPWSEVRSSMGVSSGKWYWEVLYVSTAELEGWTAGLRSSRGALFQAHWYSGSWSTATNGHCYGLLDSGAKVSDGSYTASFTSALSANDIIGFALDLDSGTTTLGVYVNGSSVGTMYSSLAAGETWTPALCLVDPAGSTSVAVMNLGSDSSFAGAKTAQGNQDANKRGDFYYAPPAGFLALCSDNLPDPAIALPGENFNSVLYTGDGQTTKAITGVGFQPELVWLKSRSHATGHILQDVVRGATKRLEVNSTGAEVTDATYVASFNSDGFTVGNNVDTNRSNGTFASWNWKAGGTAVSNSEGSVTSSVSANTAAGFSICSFTMGASSSTIGHGLSQAPELVIFKSVGTTDGWYGQWPETGNAARVMLNENAPVYTSSSSWSSTSPTATVFTANINHSGTSIAYCFHSVEGFSNIGSYEGNGSGDGPFIYTGFTPAMVIIKNIDDTQDWSIWDNRRPGYNVSAEYLKPNDATTESSATSLDMVSNGFRCRGTSDINNSSKTMIYIAFAESPFKTANAR